MANYYDQRDIFADGAGARPSVSLRRVIFPSDADALVDNALFALDGTAVTPGIDNIGTRPCFNLTNSGSTATDGLQGQTVSTAAPLILQPGKTARFKAAIRMTTTTQEFFFGFSALDTSIIASQPTDFIGMRKLTGAVSPSIVSRKASGTAETYTVPVTLAADTWYDLEVSFRLDASVAGRGFHSTWMGTGIQPGNLITGQGTNIAISAQFPDTIALAPSFGWRAGSAANVSAYIAYMGWIVEA